MDKQTRDDMESMAEWASTMDAYDRLQERRARRHRWFRFWFSPWQVADGPDVPVPSPEARALPHTSAALGLGSGAAGRFAASPPVTHRPGLDSGSRNPGRPHHLTCSEASRISAALNRHT